MKETGDEKPESSGSSDDSGEVRPAEGMQEAEDEEDVETSELEARKDVRADVAVEAANTVAGEFAEAATPLLKYAYEVREHIKIQIDRGAAVVERKLSKKSEE
jgi:hypothetical protein